jgi:hypothetical protein
MVKHLQTEVARLEAELRTPDRTSSSDILAGKIKQVTSLTNGAMLTSDIQGYLNMKNHYHFVIVYSTIADGNGNERAKEAAR